MATEPFRDERTAALARVEILERDLERTRRELAATKRELARRRREPWQRTVVGGMAALAALLMIMMGLALLFGGCTAQPFAHRTFTYVSGR